MMASEKRLMVEIPVVIEDARVAEEGAVGNVVEDTSTLIGAVTPQTETEMVTEEMGVWDGPKKRIFDGHPFNEDKHSCPKVRVDPQTDIPLTNTGHLPNLGTILGKAEEERLQALYVRCLLYTSDAADE